MPASTLHVPDGQQKRGPTSPRAPGCAVRLELDSGAEQFVRWCSLDRLSLLLSKNLVQQCQIVESGEIGHLPAEEAIFERLLSGRVECCVQGVVCDLQSRKSLVENIGRQGFVRLALNLLVQ